MPYLFENFDRNANWILKEYPHLSSIGQRSMNNMRLAESWRATLVSNRLLMFHIFFLQNIGHPRFSTLENGKVYYDLMYGMPTTIMKEILQNAIRKIQRIKGWPEYFSYLGIICPSDAELAHWLEVAIFNSHKKYRTSCSGSPQMISSGILKLKLIKQIDQHSKSTQKLMDHAHQQHKKLKQDNLSIEAEKKETPNSVSSSESNKSLSFKSSSSKVSSKIIWTGNSWPGNPERPIIRRSCVLPK